MDPVLVAYDVLKRHMLYFPPHCPKSSSQHQSHTQINSKTGLSTSASNANTSSSSLNFSSNLNFSTSNVTHKATLFQQHHVPQNQVQCFDDGDSELSHILEHLEAVRLAETPEFGGGGGSMLSLGQSSSPTHGAKTPSLLGNGPAATTTTTARKNLSGGSSGGSNSSPTDLGGLRSRRSSLPSYSDLRRAVDILQQRVNEAQPLPTPCFGEFAEIFCAHMQFHFENTSKGQQAFSARYALRAVRYFFCISEESASQEILRMLQACVIHRVYSHPSGATSLARQGSTLESTQASSTHDLPTTINKSDIFILQKEEVILSRLDPTKPFLQRLVAITSRLSEFEDQQAIYFMSHSEDCFGPLCQVRYRVLGAAMELQQVCQQWGYYDEHMSTAAAITRYSDVCIAIAQLSTNNYPMSVTVNTRGQEELKIIPQARLFLTIGVPSCHSDETIQKGIQKILKMVEFLHGPMDLIAWQYDNPVIFRDMIKVIGAQVEVLAGIHFWEQNALIHRQLVGSLIADIPKVSTQRLSALACSSATKVYIGVQHAVNPEEEEIIASCIFFQQDVVLSDCGAELTELLSTWAVLPPILPMKGSAAANASSTEGLAEETTLQPSASLLSQGSQSSFVGLNQSFAGFRGSSQVWQPVAVAAGGQFPLSHYQLFNNMECSDFSGPCFDMENSLPHSLDTSSMLGDHFSDSNSSTVLSTGRFISVGSVFLNEKICQKLECFRNRATYHVPSHHPPRTANKQSSSTTQSVINVTPPKGEETSKGTTTTHASQSATSSSNKKAPTPLSPGWYYVVRIGVLRTNAVVLLRIHGHQHGTSESQHAFKQQCVSDQANLLKEIQCRWQNILDYLAIEFSQLDQRLVQHDRPQRQNMNNIDPKTGRKWKMKATDAGPTHCLVHDVAQGTATFIGDTLGISTARDYLGIVGPQSIFSANQFLAQARVASTLLQPFQPHKRHEDDPTEMFYPMASEPATRVILRQNLIRGDSSVTTPQMSGTPGKKIPSIAAIHVGSQRVFFSTSEVNGASVSHVEDKLLDYLKTCPRQHAVL